MRVHKKRDGGIGVTQPMLYLSDRSAARDHGRSATMAEGVEGYAAQLRACKGRVELGLEHLRVRHGLSVGARKYQSVYRDRTLKLPTLELADQQSRDRDRSAAGFGFRREVPRADFFALRSGPRQAAADHHFPGAFLRQF